MTLEKHRFYANSLQNQKKIIRLLTMIDGKLRQIKKITRTLNPTINRIEADSNDVQVQDNDDGPEQKEGEATPNLCHAPLLARAAEVPGWSCGDSYWTLYGLQHGVSTEELGQEEEQVVDKEEATVSKVSIISEQNQDQQNTDADEEMFYQEDQNQDQYQTALSKGCLSRIGSGTVFGPRLQILGYKKLECQQTQEFLDCVDRYRICLSDSEYYNNSFYLDTKLNHMIEDKLLEENTIICLTNFTIRHSITHLEGLDNHAILMNSMDIIESGMNVGQKIGNPVKIRATSICSHKT